MSVPTLCVGMHLVTLCVTLDAERPGRHSHAERGNDQTKTGTLRCITRLPASARRSTPGLCPAINGCF
ncbi:hypothetical protein EVS84_24475 [Pseudomonas koreensis]|uniref:Uncharacterized protein n=1 Tax=Pseudomonas koreensis TaxID=198620 RepID=A0A4Q4KW73_9PSED|nr:hypothetical protein EVS84_24475 [Pseudomonas koreensis]